MSFVIPHLDYVIFDLDNTLYPPTSGLMQEIGRRIQLWVQHYLGLNWEETQTIRREYLLRYGTTLGGLIAEHGLEDVQAYLHFVHDITIEDYLAPDPLLAEMLARMPVRKAVYTNATRQYALRVLRALCVRDLFDAVIGIEEVGLQNKVCRGAYEHVLEHLHTTGPRCVMVEDTINNLKQARHVGMTTILVQQEEKPLSSFVNFAVTSVLEVGPVVQALLNDRQKQADR
ncbi:MAG TPA: pyrimidine 5'-nucleotidase [Chloroflexi bacterium]|nr:pyrimidine 5'-nucleotidase [Chloroflexota bacterium]